MKATCGYLIIGFFSLSGALGFSSSSLAQEPKETSCKQTEELAKVTEEPAKVAEELAKVTEEPVKISSRSN